MKKPAERLFTIRMWRPAAEDPGAAPDWRGAVYDVATKKTLYVVGVREITDCISIALAGRSDADDRQRSEPDGDDHTDIG